MKLLINGKKKEVPEEISLDKLINELGLEAETLIVEFNRTILKTEELQRTIPKDGDTIELIRIVGGG